MYDIFEQCFFNCDNCPRRIIPEPDYDLIRDLEREDKDNG